MLKGEDIGIDLGTASVLIYVRGKGIVLKEPSVIAVVQGKREVKAVGAEAYRMLGRTPGNIVAVRPLKDGVIADYALTEKMLLLFLQKVLSPMSRLFKGRVRIMVGVPSGVTDVERRAVVQAVSTLAHKVYLIEEPLAAAIGAGRSKRTSSWSPTPTGTTSGTAWPSPRREAWWSPPLRSPPTPKSTGRKASP